MSFPLFSLVKQNHISCAQWDAYMWAGKWKQGGKGAHQQYQVLNMSTSLRANEEVCIFQWLRCACILPFHPDSITEQLLRKQTEYQWSVNNTEVFSILQREAQVQALLCATHPKNAGTSTLWHAYSLYATTTCSRDMQCPSSRTLAGQNLFSPRLVTLVVIMYSK